VIAVQIILGFLVRSDCCSNNTWVFS